MLRRTFEKKLQFTTAGSHFRVEVLRRTFQERARAYSKVSGALAGSSGVRGSGRKLWLEALAGSCGGKLWQEALARSSGWKVSSSCFRCTGMI